MFIDSHAHLDDKRFNADRDMIIKNLKENKVDYVFNIGADIKTSEASVDLAKKYDNIYAAVGIHPHSAKEANGAAMDRLRELAEEEKVIAIGEIGLDYYYDNSPRDTQIKWFKEQIKLAKEVDLPIIIHTRDASRETFDILKEDAKNHPVIMHCYSGSVEMAEEYLKLGYYISLAGPVTFKNARVPKEVAEMIPLDRLLIETDCPYLTPTPYRGKRNEPIYVRYVAEEIAKIKGISVEELAKATSQNTKKAFKL